MISDQDAFDCRAKCVLPSSLKRVPEGRMMLGGQWPSRAYQEWRVESGVAERRIKFESGAEF